MSDLNYVNMLEIPVNSCNVIIKPVKCKKKDVKKQVIEMVNGDQTPLENQTEQVQKKVKKQKLKKEKKDRVSFIKTKKVKPKKEVAEQSGQSVEIKSTGFDIVSAQVVAIFVLVVGIILTNIFWEDSGINNLMRSVFNENQSQLSAVSYQEFSAYTPSKTNEVSLQDGVMTIKQGSVYSPCDGVVSSVVEQDGLFTVTIMHSDSFSTVVSSLETVYVTEGEKVYSNIPLGYSNGSSSVSMFDGDAILTSYTLTDNQIVWIS